MGKFVVIIQPTAKKDLKKHKRSGDKATAKKLIKILDELSEHPYSGTGKPEALKHDLKGYWSRRINKKDRVIYHAKEEKVKVLVVLKISSRFIAAKAYNPRRIDLLR